MDDSKSGVVGEKPPMVGMGVEASRDRQMDYIKKALLAIALLLILLAAIELYFSIQQIIGTWVQDQYVPVVQSLYYLLVIAAGLFLIRTYSRWL